MTITCHQITHDGEGEPGESVEFIREGMPLGWYAAEAADYFHDIEKSSQCLTDSDLNGCYQVIEVRVEGKPAERFRVHCEVVRKYRYRHLDSEAEANHD